VVVALLARHSEQVGVDLPNRMPEAAPYVTEEAKIFPPPYEEYWKTQNNPGQCQTCHSKIFDEWNGSQMANAWRDPVWRGAYLLMVRLTSTNGNCDLPSPPDGTEKAVRNPFAKPGECASTFDIGNEHVTLSRPGSVLDAFCSRCHMPTNYLDNHHPKDIVKDADGNETARPDPNFNPTGDNGTGIAFATVDEQFRNTETGKTGIFCAICHTMGATRDTPFHNYERSDNDKNYTPALGTASRNELLPADKADMMNPADPTKTNLGYSIGAGAYRLSPHAIVFPERFGPLAAQDLNAEDKNTSSVFGESIPFQHMDASKHKGYQSAMFVRSEVRYFLLLVVTIVSNDVCAAEPTAAKFLRGINLHGPALIIDGNQWEGGDTPNLRCNGNAFDNQSVTLKPGTDPERARMIRSSRWGREIDVDVLNIPAVPGLEQGNYADEMHVNASGVPIYTRYLVSKLKR